MNIKAYCYSAQLTQVPALNALGITTGSKTYVSIFLGLRSEIVDIIWVVACEKETCGIWWLAERITRRKVDFFLSSPDIILCCWLGLKHHITNCSGWQRKRWIGKHQRVDIPAHNRTANKWPPAEKTVTGYLLNRPSRYPPPTHPPPPPPDDQIDQGTESNWTLKRKLSTDRWRTKHSLTWAP